MAKGKGTNLENLKAYVLDRHGAEAYRRVLEALSPEDREQLERLNSISWYDFELEPRMLRAIDRVLGQGDLSLIEEIAVFVAERDLNGIHRLFIKFANPGFLLSRCGEYWSRFYDTGRWQVMRHSSRKASGKLCGVDVKDEAFCLFLGAYIRRMFELTGAKNAALAHPRCRARGDLECVFDGSWN